MPVALQQATVRLFSDDIRTLKKIAAAKRSKWQIELRQTLHRALKSGQREVTVLKERT